MSSYDTAEGIAGFLGSLEGLNKLCELRREALKRTELGEFCILGRFFLDSRGNFGRIKDLIPAKLYRVNRYAPEKQCPRVMTESELRLFMRGESMSWSIERPPTPEESCSVCKKGWTINDCHDVVGDNELRAHEACYRKRLAARQRAEVRSAFFAAGFPNVNLITIPNEYEGPEYYYAPPWYLVQVGDGPVFKLGWRKHVIHIDWDKTEKLLPDLFSDQETSHAEHYVHAWGYEKLTEYLKRLIPALEAT